MARKKKKTDAVPEAPSTPEVTEMQAEQPAVAQAADAPSPVSEVDTSEFVELSEVVIIKRGKGLGVTGTEEMKYDVVEVTLFAKPHKYHLLSSNVSVAVARGIARTERARRGGITRNLI